jgi:hypothetical protein
MKTNFLFIAQTGFIALTLVFFTLLVREIKKGIDKTVTDPFRKKKMLTRIVFSLFAWGIFVTVCSLSGIMSDFSKFPFNFMPIIAIPLIATIIILTSKKLSEILQQIPVANLIRLQSFRFFVELLLWSLFTINLVPVQMTFEGRNFDILAGITAPFIAWLAANQKISRTALIFWNLICLGLLINIVGIAILSTPSPWRIFMNEPANTIVTVFPVSLLPGFLVPLAYVLHLFSLKQLFLKSEPANAILKGA